MGNEIAALDFIIEAIKAIQNSPEEDWPHLGDPNEGPCFWGLRYVLDQLIRQYHIKDDHKYVSVKAKALWDSLSTKDIKDFAWQNRVECDAIPEGGSVTVSVYTGASKEGQERQLTHGSCFPYKDVFHDEHIVPIKVIMDELCALKELTYDSVLTVLNKIRVVKMLKGEDRAIATRYRRSGDWREVYRHDYADAGIELLTLDGNPVARN